MELGAELNFAYPRIGTRFRKEIKSNALRPEPAISGEHKKSPGMRPFLDWLRGSDMVQTQVDLFW